MPTRGLMEQSSIKKLFKNHAAPLKLFKVVEQYILSFDKVNMSVTKTQVAFKTKRQFAWVWMPQTWIRQAPEGGIVVSFSLGHREQDERIKESLEPYPGRYMHHVVIEHATEFDTKVKEWLREAYTFSLQGKEK